MFEHSVKVPRHFKIAANIVKKVSTEGGSVKTLLYDEKLRHFRTNVLYALITETIKHAADIEKIFDTCGILVNEPRFDPWLAKVLTAELLFGKKALPGKSKPEQTILSYKEQFEKYTSLQDDMTSKVVRRPRYVRINTNLLTTSDAIRAFQDEGYKFIRCTSGSYDDYLQQIQTLTEYDFTQDYHVKTMFVFAPGTKLHEHDLYLENQIILQDKATALAVHLLAPPPGSVVLDMCAAPGMKTTQLAAYLKNQGKIYAVERNDKRYQTLCDFVEKTASKCVETLHKDSLEIKRGDYDDVEYIILDPSCSGSGMELSVHNYIEDIRLAKLTSLQEKFLKHAMNSFPNAKRIVYSTCSLFPEENERVITNVVKTSRAKWRVQDVKELLKGQWNNFGSGMYGSMGNRCLYAKPDSDFTTGFFLAVLDREPRESHVHNAEDSIGCNNKNGEEKNEIGYQEGKEMKQKHKKKNQTNLTDSSNIQEVIDNEPSVEELPKEHEIEINKKHKKKKKKEERMNVTNSTEGPLNNDKTETEEILDGSNNIKKKKKRKKDKMNEPMSETVNDNEKFDITSNGELPKSKKKKKKDKDNYTNNEENNVNADVIDDDEINHSKKAKKKKRKRNEDEEGPDNSNTELKNGNTSEMKIDDNLDTIENTAKVNKKKKKKTKHHEDVEINYICNDIVEVPKKKRKKHKEVSVET